MLDLNELKAGLPAITPVWGSALAEAASVCLETQGHRQGVRLIVTVCWKIKPFEHGLISKKPLNLELQLSRFCWLRKKLVIQ